MSPSMIVMKPIKPTALKSADMNRILTAELQKTASEILFDFEVTAWNWKHKVKFTKLISVGPASVDILVGTDDEIYGYVDQGTKTHTISAKNKPLLRFKVGGRPKTMPGVMVSGQGAPGTQWISKKKVRNKIQARKFTKTIQKSWDKGKFKNRMEKAMNDGVKASGHQII